MTITSSPSCLLQTPILFISLVDGLVRMPAPTSTLSRSGFFNLVLPNFCVPSQEFVLSYLMVNGMVTESVDKQVYHHGWHHYCGHSCVGEGNNQFYQHKITVRILYS